MVFYSDPDRFNIASVDRLIKQLVKDKQLTSTIAKSRTARQWYEDWKKQQ